MKKNLLWILSSVLFSSTQFIDAATFRILNYSGETIKVRPIWNRGNEEAALLRKGEITKEYDTGGHRILKIEWCVNGVKYDIDLSSIDSYLMLERDFAILQDGYFQHTFVSFPRKFDNGKAKQDPRGCI